MVDSEDFKYLRQVVDVIEERLPGGKWITKVVLTLLVLMVVVWSFSYVWRNALVPLSTTLAALFQGTIFNIRIGFSEVLALAIGVAYLILGLVLGSRVSTTMSSYLRITQENTKVAERAFGAVNDMRDLVNQLHERIEALEKKPVEEN